MPSPGYAAYALAVKACAQGYYDPSWTVGQNVLLATGQGYLEASPLQMAVAYSAIVNGGTVWQPQIGTQILSASGKLVAAAAGAGPPPRPAISAADRALILEGLHAAAQSPSGTSVRGLRQLPPHRLRQDRDRRAHRARRTSRGTSSTRPTATRPIVIAVTIEQGGFGAAAAAPAARLMLSQWFGLPKQFLPGTEPRPLMGMRAIQTPQHGRDPATARAARSADPPRRAAGARRDRPRGMLARDARRRSAMRRPCARPRSSASGSC